MSRWALWSALGPLTWPFWALAAATLASLLRGPAARRWAVRLTGLAFALALAVFVLPTGFWLIRPLEARLPATPPPPGGPTDIVMLSGGERLSIAARTGRLELGEHGERMIEAAAQAHQHPAARLWAVGGAEPWPGGPKDVDWTTRAWARLGIAPARIAMVRDTADTCQNAEGIRRRLKPGARVLLVTSAFHMPRAVACFRAQGIEPWRAPADNQSWPGARFADSLNEDWLFSARRINLALHEWMGLGWYWFTGRTRELWPAPVSLPQAPPAAAPAPPLRNPPAAIPARP